MNDNAKTWGAAGLPTNQRVKSDVQPPISNSVRRFRASHPRDYETRYLRLLKTIPHEQVAAEIDMHAEVLPALGQRLDLVLHRVGQRRQLE